MTDLSVDERLDILLQVKATVEQHNTKVTKEIVTLLNREADLLLRRTKSSMLTGLRKRILNLFLQFAETPEANPEAARLLEAHKRPNQHRKDIHRCLGCDKFLPSTEFDVGATSKGMGKCRKCLKLANDAGQREDVTQYRRILEEAKRKELKHNDGAQVCHEMGQQDCWYRRTGCLSLSSVVQF
eukprot:m.43861 g.43861  ORF g.43861 m.43861 type:complete len:184 (-) comp11665_c0_seq1:379-930(-)